MRRLFLDCDGVLADFEKGAARVLGMPGEEYREKYGLGGFWKAVAETEDFFARLDPMPDAYELYEAVKHLNPVILTGLPRGNWAEPQKRRWGEQHFPGVRMITTSAALKREHCDPGDVLVDDRLDYAHLWENSGGIFVHHRDARTTIRALKKLGMLQNS